MHPWSCRTHLTNGTFTKLRLIIGTSLLATTMASLAHSAHMYSYRKAALESRVVPKFRRLQVGSFPTHRGIVGRVEKKRHRFGITISCHTSMPSTVRTVPAVLVSRHFRQVGSFPAYPGRRFALRLRSYVACKKGWQGWVGPRSPSRVTSDVYV